MGNDTPYGSESMTVKQTGKMENVFREYERKETFQSIAGQGFADRKIDSIESETKKKIKRAGDRANAEDSLLSRVKDFTKQSIRRSSWLRSFKMPEKAEIDDEMKKAEATFGIKSMSKSQRTKRGKKFKEKAKLQAEMVSELTSTNWLREEAMYKVLDEETPSLYMQPDLLDEAEAADPEMAMILKDTAHYYKQNEVYWEDSGFEKSAREAMKASQLSLYSDLLSKDKVTRDKAFEKILKHFLELDLSQFDYKSDKEFVKGDGKNTFAQRYATLRAYSHVREIIKRCRKGNDYPTLYAKADTIKEILADYDRRALFLQSPYYALLAGKDVDSFSDEELRKRIGKTEDPFVKAYMEKMLENRLNFGFTKGRKAEEIMKQNFDPEKKAKNEEKKRKAREKEQEKLRKK